MTVLRTQINKMLEHNLDKLGPMHLVRNTTSKSWIQYESYRNTLYFLLHNMYNRLGELPWAPYVDHDTVTALRQTVGPQVEELVTMMNYGLSNVYCYSSIQRITVDFNYTADLYMKVFQIIAILDQFNSADIATINNVARDTVPVYANPRMSIRA